jgi:hypothetical protein
VVEVTIKVVGLLIVEGVVGVGGQIVDDVRGENLERLNRTLRLLQWNRTIQAPRTLYRLRLTR